MIPQLANALRFLSIDMVENAQSGHPGLPLGMADVVTVLFCEYLTFYPKDPAWPNRDRFVLSAGHGSALLYSLLHVCGYQGMTVEQLKQFRHLNSLTPGHPEYGHTPGVEATTGPLGQGLAMAVGMAMGQHIINERIDTPPKRTHRVYALCSDGDLMEGISQEAITLAGHLKLSNLTILFDDNKVTIDGPTSLSTSENVAARFLAAGFHVVTIDGHNYDQIRRALDDCQTVDKPTLVMCQTIIGYGAPYKQGTSACHGSPLGAAEIKATREALNWPHAPFDMPQDIAKMWYIHAHRHEKTYQQWCVDSKNYSPKNDGAVSDPIDISPLRATFAVQKAEEKAQGKAQGTRIYSQQVLEHIALPQLVGGSADLTPSNNTKLHQQAVFNQEDSRGTYIHFGIREHAMAAILNGLSLYGEIIPYGGTFLVFSDYMRPAMRLSALMKRQVLYILTHDSIGLGEDGPTHQPVEHLAALRAIPNLYIFRPADALETFDCYDIALQKNQSPSVMALSRQPLSLLPYTDTGVNRCAKGGYVLHEPAQQAVVTLVASGSEVSLAYDAALLLQERGLYARVVSMPCVDLFHEQSEADQQDILGDVPCLVIEAGVKQGWEFATAKGGAFIGMTGFGASGNCRDLYQYFGITTDTIINTVVKIVGHTHFG